MGKYSKWSLAALALSASVAFGHGGGEHRLRHWMGDRIPPPPAPAGSATPTSAAGDFPPAFRTVRRMFSVREASAAQLRQPRGRKRRVRLYA